MINYRAGKGSLDHAPGPIAEIRLVQIGVLAAIVGAELVHGAFLVF